MLLFNNYKLSFTSPIPLICVYYLFLESRLSFLRSSRGRNWLIHQGFCYRKDSCGLKKQSWRCVKCSKYKCYARVHTQNGKVVRQIGYHNHVSDALNIFDPSSYEEITLSPQIVEILPDYKQSLE